MGPSCQFGLPPPASSQTLHEVFISPTQGPAAWGGLSVHIEPMLNHLPSPQASSQTLCWDPGCMFAVPLPCIREQLSHSQLLVPHAHQGSKAGTSLGSDCTYTLIFHAPRPHCLLSGLHTLLRAYSSCLVFAHTRHSISTLFPAPPPSQSLPEH